jgi:hypothetical protein
MQAVIYGETGGTDYEDMILVGWSLRNKYEKAKGKMSYDTLGRLYFAPRYFLRRTRDPMAELDASTLSLDVAREVLRAPAASNPIPGVSNFYSPARMKPPFSEPWWAKGRNQFPSSSDRFIFVEGVP